eukprot:11201490-Lingulodinium_polyedra.AAC.1
MGTMDSEEACTRARYACHTSVHAQMATGISDAEAHGVPASMHHATRTLPFGEWDNGPAIINCIA